MSKLTMEEAKKLKATIKTEGTVNYPWLADKDTMGEYATNKHCITLVYDNADALKPVYDMLDQIVKARGKSLAMDCPIKENEDGTFQIKPRTNERDWFKVYDSNNKVITDADEVRELIYAGCKVKAHLGWYPHKTGISLSIAAIKFSSDGERLGNGSTIDFGDDSEDF